MAADGGAVLLAAAESRPGARDGVTLATCRPARKKITIGINQVAEISGSFIGLVLGGLLAPIQWRLIFLVSVPVGLFGTLWAYRSLKEYHYREEAEPAPAQATRAAWAATAAAAPSATPATTWATVWSFTATRDQPSRATST